MRRLWARRPRHWYHDIAISLISLERHEHRPEAITDIRYAWVDGSIYAANAGEYFKDMIFIDAAPTE